jgi:hypothetical protein
MVKVLLAGQEPLSGWPLWLRCWPRALVGQLPNAARLLLDHFQHPVALAPANPRSAGIATPARPFSRFQGLPVSHGKIEFPAVKTVSIAVSYRCLRFIFNISSTFLENRRIDPSDGLGCLDSFRGE